MEGTSNQAVTWSVDGGGAITQTGLFTSNGTEGTFFVRATSEEDPNSAGVAQVTVGTPPPPPPPGELPCIAAACTFSGTWIRCETRNDGNIVCVEVTTIFSNPQARVFPQPGQPTRVSVSFSCGQTGSLSSLGGTIQPTGGFTVSQLVGSNPCLLGTATGMLTASSLQFTLVDGFDPRRVFSFSGSR